MAVRRLVASWRKPIVFVAGGVLVVAVSTALLVDALVHIGDRTALAGASICSTANSHDCLAPITGSAFEFPSRGPGSSWQFEPSSDVRDSQSVNVSMTGSRKLREHEGASDISGLFWEGELVAFQLPTGEMIESQEFGDRGNVWILCLTLGGIGVGFVPISAGLAARRKSGSWWTTAGPDDFDPRGSELGYTAIVFFLPCMTTAFLLALGASVGWSLAAGCLGLAAAGYLAAPVILGVEPGRGRRRSGLVRHQHVSESDD